MKKKGHTGVSYGSSFLGREEINVAAKVIESQSLFRYYGPELLFMANQFEEQLRTYFKQDYALVVSSGTAAIKCALRAIDIQPGDEVIVPSYGFIATAGAVSNVGAIPVFADINSTMTINLDDIKRKVTNKTKAIIVVHLFGSAGNIKEIVQFASEHHIKVIEDVAQAMGGEYKGKKLGTFGDVGCYSFQANKIVCTGEGGAIITNNELYYTRAKMYHDQGGLRIGCAFPTWNDSRCFLGENLRMSELHAAIGIEQMKKLPMMLELLQKRKDALKKVLAKYNLNYRKILSEKECNTNLIFFIDDLAIKNKLKGKLEEKGILVSCYYNSSVYENKLFGDDHNCPYSDRIATKVFGLPIIMAYSDYEYQKYIVKIVECFEDIFLEKCKVIKKMFKKNILSIKEVNNLDYSINYLPDLYVFKDDLSNRVFNEQTVVIGGPCIDRCEAQVANLGLNFYLDILMPLNYAASKNLRCLIYLDTPIEEQNMVSDVDILNKWMKLADEIEEFILNVSKTIGVKDITVIRREKVYKELDELLQEYNINNDNIKDLYNLCPSVVTNLLDEQLALHYKRVITAYQPQFINNHTNRTSNQVIVVEALSQGKAIFQAKRIDKNIIPQLYIDMPSISGNNRMHRSSNGIITLFEDINRDDLPDNFIAYMDQINLSSIYSTYGVDNFIDLCKYLKGVWGDV